MVLSSKSDKSLVDDDGEGSLLDSPGMGHGAIYLMRHGHTVLDASKRSDGFLDFPLSDQGRLALIAAQQILKTVPLKTIHTPSLRRTTETAQIIKSGTLSNPNVSVNDDGRTWNLGILAGTRKRYGRPEVQKLIDDPDSAPMGGESFNDFQDRFLPWFNEATKSATRAQPVLYVGSGSNLRLLGQVICGDPESLDLDEGGLACLHKVGGQWHGEKLLGPDDQRDDVS
jgi:broad specificity phosphatase PhoE